MLGGLWETVHEIPAIGSYLDFNTEMELRQFLEHRWHEFTIAQCNLCLFKVKWPYIKRCTISTRFNCTCYLVDKDVLLDEAFQAICIFYTRGWSHNVRNCSVFCDAVHGSVRLYEHYHGPLTESHRWWGTNLRSLHWICTSRCSNACLLDWTWRFWERCLLRRRRFYSMVILPASHFHCPACIHEPPYCSDDRCVCKHYGNQGAIHNERALCHDAWPYLDDRNRCDIRALSLYPFTHPRQWQAYWFCHRKIN